MVIERKYIKLLFWLFVRIVLIVSSVPGSVGQSILHLDKLIHIAAFFVLSILMLLAYRFSKPFLSTAIIMAMFGLGIELLHLYVPRRVFSLYDLAADLLGVVIALIVYQILRNTKLTSQ
jgi:Predicted integral membrane protein